MKAGLGALRHRNYRLFFGGQVISLVGTWMQTVAQGWLVLQLTRDPLWLGLVAAAQFGPVILLGPFGGVLADQLPKRPTLIASQAVAMILAFILFGLTATGVVEVWHVLILAVLLGVTNSVDMPARQAFAVEMVGREDMPNAVALNAAQFNASRIVGPAIAGILIGVFDLSLAFLLNALSYVAVLVAYSAMREEELRPAPALERPSSLADVMGNLAEGVRYAVRTPLVTLAVVVVGMSATFGMNFQVLVPPLADTVLRVGASGFGFLMAASGIGSTLISLRIAFTKGGVGPRPIPIGSITLGLASLLLAWSPSFGIALAAMAIAGMGGIGMAVAANTTIQSIVPDHLRGRVIAVYGSVFMGSVPVGGLFSGFIASTFGVPAAFAVGGVATLAVGIGALVWLTRMRTADRVAWREPAAVGAGVGTPGSGAIGDPLGVGRRR